MMLRSGLWFSPNDITVMLMIQPCYNICCLFVLFCLIVFNAIFNNISVISWRSVLLMEKIGGPGENYRPVASHWETYNIAYDSAQMMLRSGLWFSPKWCYGQAYDSAQMILRSGLWFGPNDTTARLMNHPKWCYGHAYDSAQMMLI
jgi:hypothetical protein